MTARIFCKLILAVVLIMVVALSTLDILGARMAERAYRDGLTVQLTQKLEMLRVLHAQQLLEMDHEELLSLARAAGGRLTLIRSDGRVLLDSEADAERMENHGRRQEIRDALGGRIGVAVRPSPTLGQTFLYVAGPAPPGALRIAVPLREIDAQVTQIRRRLLLYTALAFLPAILLAALFARYISAKLGAIIEFASTLATGNFHARLEDVGHGELGVLGLELNQTGSKLQKMLEEMQREHLELEKLERVRKDFVINVSHELRTPLASIQGYTETLLDGALEDRENNVRFLTIIRQNAERLSRLTSDLLTLSGLELKTQKLRLASYYLAPLLAGCRDSLQPMADRKNVRLDLLPVPPDLEVFSDAESVHQMLANLLDNAIKYTPEGGQIQISGRAVPGPSGRAELVEVSVTDTGSGIPAEELPRLFERFYRVDKARSRELGGTGLGLAIVKHLARAQGGDVHVESVLNQGSTFSFTLPIRDPEAVESGSFQSQFIVP